MTVIRCGLTAEGDIEAAFRSPWVGFKFVVCDKRTGRVVRANAKEGSDEFRHLVRAARVHCGRVL